MSSVPGRPSQSSRFGAFRHRGFLFYWLARLASNFAVNIVSVSVGWQVYDLTHDPLDLGIIGLVQFLPALVLVLVTGSVADRYNRRMIMALCLCGEGLCILGLLLFTLSGSHMVSFVFAILLGFGVVRAFIGPAMGSLAPNLVPPEDLGNAIALNSSSWQIAAIVGPVIGGLAYGIFPSLPYIVGFVLMAIGSTFVLLVPKPVQKIVPGKASWQTVVAGFQYVWKEKIVLGAISLDLFAVLLGGANALLPIYARDVLVVGPWGLGLLRSAPAFGAIAVALWLAVRPIQDHAGRILFLCVGLFGFFTLIFGLSTSVWLSVVALAMMGAADMFSVYIRETLIQLWTPDSVRGRVNAVNQVFLGASNELGEFRAGVSATFLGAVGAVAFGAVGTMAVAAIWAKLFPSLRQARHLDGGV